MGISGPDKSFMIDRLVISKRISWPEILIYEFDIYDSLMNF